VLVVASEVMTRTLNWKDRATCILWGDGAGAAVLTWDKTGPEVLSTHIHTHGADGQNLQLPGGGSKTTPISHESIDEKKHLLNIFEANLSFRAAVRYFIESIKEAARFNHVSIKDIDWFIPHQANLRMFQNISKSLNIPFEKFYLNLQKYGNISSASCAIALDEAVRKECIQPGHLVCLPVFGGGLTWGSALIRW
jgi:3-oxoacyl-[acyl-carrier-protein] synthase-3